MLMPKKVKYRKQQRGRMCGKAWRGSDVSFGDYGLKAMEPCWMTDRQIEAARVAMTRFIKRGGKIWVRVFPDKPVTKKPLETRMGKGKGAPEGWVAVVRPGKILFEMEGVPEATAREAFRLAGAKLSVASGNPYQSRQLSTLLADADRRVLAGRRRARRVRRGADAARRAGCHPALGGRRARSGARRGRGVDRSRADPARGGRARAAR